MKTTPTNWHGLHKGLHWLVLLLVMVWGAVELHEFYAKGDPMREWWKMLHFSLGLTILVVVLVRLYARTLYPRPAPVGAAWQRQLSRLVHVLLYSVLLAMPLGGFAMRQFAGKTIEIFGMFSVPQLTEIRSGQADCLHPQGSAVDRIAGPDRPPCCWRPVASLHRRGRHPETHAPRQP